MENALGTHTVRWKLVLVTFVLLVIVFGLATPFNFDWPELVKLKEINSSASASISRIEKGNRGRQVGLLLLAAISVISLAKTENRYRVNLPVGWIFLFYLSLIIFSLSWSFDLFFTLRRVVIVFILWMSAIVFAGRYSLREIAFLAVLVNGTILILGFGNELRLGTFEPSNVWWRFSGFFHTVSMGWNCGLLALASMFLITDEKNTLRRSVLWVVLAAAIVFLVLTKSRMAFASTLFAMGLYWYRVISGRNKILMVLGLIIAICLSYLVLSDQWGYYAEEATTLGRGEAAKESVNDLTGRLPLWKYCFRRSEERPILGWGFNTFVSPNNLVDIERNVGWAPSSIHSGYIDAVMGLGYVGAAALIFFLFSALARAYSLSRKHSEYIFVFSVLIWLCYNIALEASLITRPSIMSFVCMILLARLALLPGPEWERKE